MSNFIDVISTQGVKYSINVSHIISVQKENKETIIYFTPSKEVFCIYVNISYEEVMKLIREQ
jgi:hypothetical protein